MAKIFRLDLGPLGPNSKKKKNFVQLPWKLFQTIILWNLMEN